MGYALVLGNSASEGLSWLERALAVAKRLTQIDPSNAVWAGDKAVIETILQRHGPSKPAPKTDELKP